MFDSFLQYFKIIKNLASQVGNTRFILFNYLGQSHTLFEDSNQLSRILFNQVLGRLLYELTFMLNQLMSKLSFEGIGYGSYLLQDVSYIHTNNPKHDINGF